MFIQLSKQNINEAPLRTYVMFIQLSKQKKIVITKYTIHVGLSILQRNITKFSFLDGGSYILHKQIGVHPLFCLDH